MSCSPASASPALQARSRPVRFAVAVLLNVPLRIHRRVAAASVCPAFRYQCSRIFGLFPAVTARARDDVWRRYLFVWAGDQARRAPDFLTVVNFDARSPDYGRVITTEPLPSWFGAGNEPQPRRPIWKVPSSGGEGVRVTNSIGHVTA